MLGFHIIQLKHLHLQLSNENYILLIHTTQFLIFFFSLCPAMHHCHLLVIPVLLFTFLAIGF